MNKFLAMAFMLCSIHLNAQTWQRLIDNPFNLGGAEAYGIRIIDDTIYVSSTFVVTDTISNTRAVITKHDINDGSLLQSAQYKSDTQENSLFNELNTGFNQLYQSDEEAFYLPLNVWNDDIDSLNKPKLLKIDRALQQLSAFPISSYLMDDIFFSFNGTRIDSEGNILLYGSRSRIGNYFDTDSANTLLVKMTPQGEQLWTKRYDDCYTINFAELLADGDIILNAGEVGNSLVSSKFLIKTNSEGEEQWRRLFGGMATSPLCTAIESSNGKIIAANSWNYSSSNEQGVGWWYRTWVQLQCIEDLGTDYQILQDVKWAPTRNIQDVYGIEEMTNGNFLSWGIMQNTSGGIYDTVGGIWDRPFTRGFLFMTDESLDSLWLRTYYYPDEDDILECYSTFRISDVAPLENGGFVTCGWGAIHDESDLEKIWLMRLDEYGCLEPGCQNINVTEIAMGLENSMTVFPNPVNTQCIIQWNVQTTQSKEHSFANTELIITDLQGKEVMRMLIDNFSNNLQKNIDLSVLPSGLYQAHWVKGSRWLDSLKIVKE